MNRADLCPDLLVVAAGLAALAAIRGFGLSPRWERPLRRFRRDRLGRMAFCVLGFYAFVGAAGLFTVDSRSLIDWMFVRVPVEQSYSAPMGTRLWSADPGRSAPLQGRHLLGTDVMGRDVLKQTMRGCSTALLVGGLASLIYIPLGVALGIVAGYYRRWVDDLITFISSTMASIPSILLMASILIMLGRGIPQMACALSVTSWIGLCRLLRGETFRESQRHYVEAARSLGQSHRSIILRHILPNVMHLVLINFVLGFSGLVLSEAILSYVGIGAPIGTPSWGAMIDSARMELSREPAVWWNLLSAGGALFFLVLSLNLLGDSLRRAFDPKSGQL